MTRRSVPSDPTARTATTNALTFSPEASDRIDALILLVATMDLSEAEVRRQTGVTRTALLGQWNGHSRYALDQQWSWGEIRDLADGLPPNLKAAVRAVEMRLFHPCEQCQEPTVPLQSRRGGRPQRFCSRACKQKAYRHRSRAAD
ncbi:hypothetical protein [Kitasatospora sp. NPDC001547]|uniref:hypothetical protein n=1 Tax=Kitasatospora sp. NPDC001547 TaxID=3364015 RepID=UPI00367BD808